MSNNFSFNVAVDMLRTIDMLSDLKRCVEKAENKAFALDFHSLDEGYGSEKINTIHKDLSDMVVELNELIENAKKDLVGMLTD